MEPEENRKVSLTRLFITLGIVLFAALAIGGSTYYVMSSNATKTKEATDKQVADMQKQIDDLQKVKAEKVTTTSPTATTANTYSNERGKYSFSLPKNTVVSEEIYGCEGLCGQAVTLISKRSDIKYENLFITISYHINPQGTTLAQVLNNDENYKNGVVTNVKDFIIGGVRGKSYNTPGMGGDSKHYKFINNNIVYRIEVSDFKPENQDASLEELLRTFKFN